MKRRAFITLLGGAAAWPLEARAQQPTMPVIGFLHSASLEPIATRMAAFRHGLSELGFVEGQNVVIEYRWARNDPARLPELVADLIRRRVALIVAPASPVAALAAKAATTTIPIVFETGADPVQAGLVPSLSRPGGNVTGVTSMTAELSAKRFGLLHEILPQAARFAGLVMAGYPNTEIIISDMRGAAMATGRQIEVLTAGSIQDIDRAFASLVQKQVAALLISPGTLFSERRVQLVMLVTHYRVPTIYYFREFVDIGGLMSYGPDVADLFRQTGIYAGRILKGEKPADLPVLRASKFELVINLQTARMLAVEVPATLLARADEVVE
jgi:putative ABC transport system substrate-binding protein